MTFLFKRGSSAPKSDWDAIKTVITAEARLQSAGEILPGRRAGVLFRPSEQGKYPFIDGLEGKLRGVLNEGPGATKTSHDVQVDEHGTQWVILEDGNFEHLTNSVFTTGNALGVSPSGNAQLRIGKLKTAPSLMPAGQRVVTALSRV